MPSQADKYGWKKGDLQLISNPKPAYEEADTQGTITEQSEES
jgi:hypothetical protein